MVRRVIPARSAAWRTALTGTVGQASAAVTALQRIAADSVGAIQWRVWLTAGAVMLVPWLIFGLLLWGRPGPVAALLMSDAQRQQSAWGERLAQVYQDPRLPARDRCTIEQVMGWPHQGQTSCPTPTTGPGSSRR